MRVTVTIWTGAEPDSFTYQAPEAAAVPRRGDLVTTGGRAAARVTEVRWTFTSSGVGAVEIEAQ